jgi:hypothetical protein
MSQVWFLDKHSTSIFTYLETKLKWGSSLRWLMSLTPHIFKFRSRSKSPNKERVSASIRSRVELCLIRPPIWRAPLSIGPFRIWGMIISYGAIM